MKKTFLILSLMVCANIFADQPPQDLEKEKRIKNLQRIAESARQRFPDNYSMQQKAIEWEFEALLKVEKIRTSINLPN